MSFYFGNSVSGLKKMLLFQTSTICCDIFQVKVQFRTEIAGIVLVNCFYVCNALYYKSEGQLFLNKPWSI